MQGPGDPRRGQPRAVDGEPRPPDGRRSHPRLHHRSELPRARRQQRWLGGLPGRAGREWRLVDLARAIGHSRGVSKPLENQSAFSRQRQRAHDPSASSWSHLRVGTDWLRDQSWTRRDDQPTQVVGNRRLRRGGPRPWGWERDQTIAGSSAHRGARGLCLARGWVDERSARRVVHACSRCVHAPDDDVDAHAHRAAELRFRAGVHRG